ncbi:MAG: hypothetical protein WBF38_09930, partial [Nitrosotalea sp.]
GATGAKGTTGAKGATGATGAGTTGAKGTTGATGPASTTVTDATGSTGGIHSAVTVHVSCPAGKIITGGGYNAESSANVFRNQASSGTGWVVGATGTTGTVTAEAICAP